MARSTPRTAGAPDPAGARSGASKLLANKNLKTSRSRRVCGSGVSNRERPCIGAGNRPFRWRAGCGGMKRLSKDSCRSRKPCSGLRLPSASGAVDSAGHGLRRFGRVSRGRRRGVAFGSVDGKLQRNLFKVGPSFPRCAEPLVISSAASLHRWLLRGGGPRGGSGNAVPLRCRGRPDACLQALGATR